MTGTAAVITFLTVLIGTAAYLVKVSYDLHHKRTRLYPKRRRR